MIAQNYKDLIATLLPPDQQEAYFVACRKPLKKSLTINKAKISPVEFEQYAREQGWVLEKHPFLETSYSYYIDRPDTSIALGNHRMHQCGFFYIQEIAAATPAYLLDLPENALVLDIAASPGGKTAQLANRLLPSPSEAVGRGVGGEGQKPGLIIANDIDTLRIRTLSENLRRMGCRNTATSKLDGTKRGERYPELFDAILVDAPCSGEGTGFKSDDALTHWRIEEIKKIAGLQLQILRSAIHACKVGGQILYSTCTLNTLENEGVLAEILKEFGASVRLEHIYTVDTESGYILPGFDAEQAKKVARMRPHLQKTGGFFLSKITKISASSLPSPSSSKARTIGRGVGGEGNNKNFYGSINTPATKRIKTLLKEYYGIELDTKRFLLFMQNDICSIASPKVLEFPLAHISTGIPLGKLVRDTWIPTHHLGAVLGHLAQSNIIDISPEQAQIYTTDEHIYLDHPAPSKDIHPFYILRRQEKGIGVVKWVQGEWKCKFEG